MAHAVLAVCRSLPLAPSRFFSSPLFSRQFKHLMQPFHVSLSPGGVEVSRTGGGASSSSPSTPAFVAAVTLSIANRYDFTEDLWEVLTFVWKVEIGGVVVADGVDLAPSLPRATRRDGSGLREQGATLGQDGGGGGGSADETSATVAQSDGASGGGVGGGGKATTVRLTFGAPSLPLPDEECHLTVTGRMRSATPWAAAGHVVGHEQLELNLPSIESVVRKITSTKVGARSKRGVR